jgi:hypothetical protein
MRGAKMSLARGAVFIGALVGAAAAQAASGVVLTTVAPLSYRVTYSTTGDGTKRNPAFTGFIGYTVKVKNTSGNTINNITWQGVATVRTGTEEIVFSSTDGLDSTTCTFSSLLTPPTANSLTVTCPIGQLKGLQERNFAIFFKSPISNNPVANDDVDFRGRTITAEGFNGGNSANDSIDCWPYTDATSCDAAGSPLTGIKVALGTSSPTRVKSAVPRNGASFFTGTGVPTPADLLAVTTSVPPVAVLGQADVIEAGDPAIDPNFTVGSGCLNNFNQCTGVQLSIPGTFGAPYLITTVRIDSSNLKNGTKIQSVTLWYTPDGGVPATDRIQIQQCPAPNTPWLAVSADPSTSVGTPCWTSRKAYSNGYKDIPELQGDFEWVLVNTKNGWVEVF